MSERVDQETTSWEPPRHWANLEELSKTHWDDLAKQEAREKEFTENPIEAIDRLDKSEAGGLHRREFLTLMGASMALAGAACTRRPIHKIIPYVVKPDQITVGVANWYASTYSSGADSYGILVKTREGRPIKVEGNPDFPLNRGALCAHAQASVLSLYDPDRLKAPMIKGSEKAWAEVDAFVIGELEKARVGRGRVHLLSGPVTGPASRQLIQGFVSKFKEGRWVEFDATRGTDIADAAEQSFGSRVVPEYRFDKAHFVLSLGADFLGTWLSPVQHTADWSKTRKIDRENRNATMSKLVVIESVFSVTGANADQRFAVRPGDELKVALAIAHEIVLAQGRSRFAGQSDVAAILKPFKPEVIADEIGGGLKASHIQRIAQELWSNKGHGLVVAGGVAGRTKDQVATQIAVNFLNSLLENEGVTVEGSGATALGFGNSFSDIAQLVQDMQAGRVDVLVLHRSNPVFSLPKSLGFEAAMSKVPLVIAIADRVDETAGLAHVVLPDHHDFESWGDVEARKGLISIVQPTIAPLHASRSIFENILVWQKQESTWHDVLRGYWKQAIFPKAAAGRSFEDFWVQTLQKGVVDLRVRGGQARSFRSASLKGLPQYVAADRQAVFLALHTNVAMRDGTQANNGWLQELPDPVTSVTWDNALAIAPSLAKQLSVETDDVVRVTSKAGVSAEVPVVVQPGQHASVVSVAIGYGRTSVGKTGNQSGVRVLDFATLVGDQLVFSGAQVQIQKVGRRFELARTQGHFALKERPIVNDITLAQYRKDAAAQTHTNPHLRMETPSLWTEHDYSKGYRWGMSIDLTACTGCSACMVACQAENNIPIVGRESVRRGRHMHWIRVDRYYTGSPESPSVVFQPMLCQHCENAPCETVCPVVATVHNQEGLNQMVYNRCVGTRYCQNNCPYKVRKFNFFDHWKDYKTTANMVWNPDVTVRTRGVMEKCSFCSQRIQEAKGVAKDKGVRVKDGDFKTACQQSCPTDAIAFGDVNDPSSRVSVLKREGRGFHVLELLNTKPSITYLSKVRNIESQDHAQGATHEHHG